MTPDSTDGTPVEIADAEILTGHIIRGLQVFRSHHGCSLREALDRFAARYEVLRRERPDAFTQSHEEYWSGFYS